MQPLTFTRQRQGTTHGSHTSFPGVSVSFRPENSSNVKGLSCCGYDNTTGSAVAGSRTTGPYTDGIVTGAPKAEDTEDWEASPVMTLVKAVAKVLHWSWEKNPLVKAAAVFSLPAGPGLSKVTVIVVVISHRLAPVVSFTMEFRSRLVRFCMAGGLISQLEVGKRNISTR